MTDVGSAYRRGEHVCSIHESAEEQVATAADYCAEGLRAGDRVLYGGESEGALDILRAALAPRGVVVSAAEKLGALVLLTRSAYLPDGVFEPGRMLALVGGAMTDATDAGFAGLRTCGDMSWLCAEPAGCEQVLEYEAQLNAFFAHAPAVGMCQYDRRRLPARFVDHALATHPSVVIDGVHKANGFYRPPEIARGRAARGDDVAWKLAELRMR
jgi:hypothetical protein